jgi:hypothetical protein
MPNRNGQASESGASDSEQAEAAATAGTGSKLTRKDVGSAETAPPALIHKVKNKKSILVVAVSKSKIFAGTQGGDILVRRPSLDAGAVSITDVSRSGRWIRTVR